MDRNLNIKIKQGDEIMKNLISNKLKNKKKFSSKLNKKILSVLGFIVVLIFGTFIVNIVLNNQGLSDDKYTVLKLKKNINKINAKGEVKSEDSTNVYSNVNLPIKEVRIKLGDKVKVNDILAILDTNKLEDQIKELEASIVTTNVANQAALENANSVYNNALVLSNSDKNQDIKNAETALNEAKRDSENKKSIYDKYKQLHERDGISDQELKTYEISYENAEDFYEKSKVTLDNIKYKVQQDLVTARTSYEAAKAKAEDNSQNITLENLKKDLNNAEIKAPVDGIISAKNASVGNQGSGILFEIVNPNNITVNVDVKEVDIEKIKVGQKAEIKSDSTGGKIIEGEVVRVEEIAKNEDNNKLDLSNDSNDKEAKYEVKLKINDPTIKLKIGMKAQADIIIDEKEEVYTVPVESVIKDKDDKDCIYVAEEQGKDYIVKEISITKGTETDVDSEIFGQDLKDNMIVLNSPSDYEVGGKVKIKDK
jgi:multidrug resistance efflux pump